MRLGDLDALKDHISELMLIYKDTELDNAILNAIDNAPTVEEVSTIEFKEPLPQVKAQKIIKALDKKPQGEWIPVSKSWPAFSGLYLVSIDDLVTVANFTGAYFINKRGLMLNVSAWQLLPEPYKN